MRTGVAELNGTTERLEAKVVSLIDARSWIQHDKRGSINELIAATKSKLAEHLAASVRELVIYCPKAIAEAAKAGESYRPLSLGGRAVFDPEANRFKLVLN